MLELLIHDITQLKCILKLMKIDVICQNQLPIHHHIY